MVTEFDAFYIERSCTEALRFLHHLAGRDEVKLCVFVHELSDEPRAGNSVYFHIFTGYPFHNASIPSFRFIRTPLRQRRVLRRALLPALPKRHLASGKQSKEKQPLR